MYTKEEAREELQKLTGKGAVVYGQTLSHTDMAQRSSFYVVYNGDIRKLDFLLEKAGFGKKRGNKPGVYLRGVQMDLEAYLVRWVSDELYGSPESLRFARL